jgi:hypothetical protein
VGHGGSRSVDRSASEVLGLHRVHAWSPKHAAGRYRSPVGWAATVLWGLFGGVLVAGLDFIAVVGRIGDWPWRARKKLRAGPYVAATLVRLLLGAGLALAAGQSGLVSNALSAVTIGIATPLIVEKLARAGTQLTAREVE